MKISILWWSLAAFFLVIGFSPSVALAGANDRLDECPLRSVFIHKKSRTSYQPRDNRCEGKFEIKNNVTAELHLIGYRTDSAVKNETLDELDEIRLGVSRLNSEDPLSLMVVTTRSKNPYAMDVVDVGGGQEFAWPSAILNGVFKRIEIDELAGVLCTDRCSQSAVYSPANIFGASRSGLEKIEILLWSEATFSFLNWTLTPLDNPNAKPVERKSRRKYYGGQPISIRPGELESGRWELSVTASAANDTADSRRFEIYVP